MLSTALKVTGMMQYEILEFVRNAVMGYVRKVNLITRIMRLTFLLKAKKYMRLLYF